MRGFFYLEVSYVRIPIRNKTDRGLSAMPDLSAVRAVPYGRPEHSPWRQFRSFLLYRPLQLREFPNIIQADRWDQLHHLSRRMAVPDQ